MVGKYDIEIYNNKVHYFLSVKRNITILQGNSATGKTELIRLIQEHEANGRSSGITLKCDVKCVVLTSVDWELRLAAMNNQIVFIDESVDFLRTSRFAQMVKGSDNYFVIVSRDDLGQLPYSVDEIYGLRNDTDTQKYRQYKRIYNEMYRLYNFEVKKDVNPDVVVTEDSNSGNEFFETIFPERCISAKGKDNVYGCIRKYEGKRILAIVDAAAFGPEIGKIIRYLKSSENECVIYAPESFEYLVLQSGILEVPKSVLDETYLHADSKQFMSWENYYTHYLTDITRHTVYQYGKSKLNAAYKTDGSIRKIKAVLPEVLVKDPAGSEG